MSCGRLKVLQGHISSSDSVKPSSTETGISQVVLCQAMASSPLTSHVLDTSRGTPARGLNVELFREDSGQWKSITKGQTNDDGRIPGLLTQAQFSAAVYKMTFHTGDYFKSSGLKTFYPYVDVVFEVEDPNQHFHVPLLLSPYGYSTYRGS